MPDTVFFIFCALLESLFAFDVFLLGTAISYPRLQGGGPARQRHQRQRLNDPVHEFPERTTDRKSVV